MSSVSSSSVDSTLLNNETYLQRNKFAILASPDVPSTTWVEF